MGDHDQVARPRIIGFDPGLERTGYGILEIAGSRPVLVEAGIIRIPSSGGLASRLRHLYSSAVEIFGEHQPAFVAVEELFSHYERPKTAILMGHARGVILLAAAERNLAVASYLPTRVKKLMTGSGRASKHQMQLAIKGEFCLGQLPEPPDIADALAVALCHFHAMRQAG